MSDSIAILSGGRGPSIKFPSPGVFRPTRAEKRRAGTPADGGAAMASLGKRLEKPLRFELRSTVRYRVDRRPTTGVVIGISHIDGFRYDIRPLVSGKPNSRVPARISFGVAHEDIEKLVAPAPDNQEVIVLSDLPPETPQPAEQEAKSTHGRLLSPLTWVATAFRL